MSFRGGRLYGQHCTLISGMQYLSVGISTFPPTGTLLNLLSTRWMDFYGLLRYAINLFIQFMYTYNCGYFNELTFLFLFFLIFFRFGYWRCSPGVLALIFSVIIKCCIPGPLHGVIIKGSLEKVLTSFWTTNWGWVWDIQFFSTIMNLILFYFF